MTYHNVKKPAAAATANGHQEVDHAGQRDGSFINQPSPKEQELVAKLDAARHEKQLDLIEWLAANPAQPKRWRQLDLFEWQPRQGL